MEDSELLTYFGRCSLENMLYWRGVVEGRINQLRKKG